MVEQAERLSDPQRLKQLQIRRILDTPQDEAFDRLTRLAAKALRTQISLITFIDGGRQWFKSSYGLREPWSSRRETPLSHSFCQYVVAYERPLIITDARSTPLVQENLAIPELGVVAYLGVPLIDRTGAVLGSFAVVGEEPREWTEEEVEIVRDFAAVAITEVELKTEIALRSEAEAVLRQAQKMDALGRLAGGVAHDFNNLLTVLHGNCGLLLQDLHPSDPSRIEVEEMYAASVRAAQLTAQLLTFSRKKVVHPRAIDLNEVLRAIEPLARRLLPENIEVTLDLDTAVAPVFADPGELEQVIVNLVVNARDAMPEGGAIAVRSVGTTAATVAARDRPIGEGRFIGLTVEDTGAGMDAETRERIFEPFFTTKQGTGTGLGLSIVYGVVTQLGGAIDVESEPGRGSRFTIWLPVCEGPSSAEETPRDVGEDLRGSATVLVVEDEATVRVITERLLRHWGYRVIAVEDAEGATAAWEQNAGKIDLLVTDVVLRGGSGARVAEHLRSLEPSLPVLYVSGYASDVVLRHVHQEERAAFLAKPFTVTGLGRKVREILDAPRGPGAPPVPPGPPG